ncbi:hypothetical protein P171DRAFT_213684 [Karstenula rhodostoma CBS 690.94]|uniref:Uncharacterized protein n=1 Tax=Karstenula rhodostoma CBS 690.94 TaxID=1392251 RepID=A0A9P4UGQ7_9PLEO|nr:hypothetical protein P171DRAFT_213684 [Karstenula rhodostoma CBS 690.94]
MYTSNRRPKTYSGWDETEPRKGGSRSGGVAAVEGGLDLVWLGSSRAWIRFGFTYVGAYCGMGLVSDGVETGVVYFSCRTKDAKWKCNKTYKGLLPTSSQALYVRCPRTTKVHYLTNRYETHSPSFCPSLYGTPLCGSCQHSENHTRPNALAYPMPNTPVSLQARSGSSQDLPSHPLIQASLHSFRAPDYTQHDNTNQSPNNPTNHQPTPAKPSSRAQLSEGQKAQSPTPS